MLNELKTSLIFNPACASTYKQMLLAIEQLGAYNDGIAFYESLLNQNPFNALAWLNLGYAFKALELHEAALEAFGFVYALDDQCLEAYIETGDIFILQKEYKNAISVFKQALAIYGVNALSYQKLGYCYEQKGQYKTACPYYMKAFELNSSDDFSLYRMGICVFIENQYRLAIRFFTHAIAIESENENYHLYAARAYKANNQFSEAIYHYRLATQMAPEQESLWIELALFLLDANQFRTAQKIIDESLSNLFTPQLEMLNIGIHYTLNRKKTALRMLRKLVKQETKESYLFLLAHFPLLINDKAICEVMVR